MKRPNERNLKIDVNETRVIRELVSKTEKIKITINIDADILHHVREMSDHSGVPYQVLINRILREKLTSKNSAESRLDRLEKEFAKLKRKLSA